MRLSRPSPEEQKEAIQPLLLKAVQEGDTWYLVSKKWLEDWESYVSNRGSRDQSLDDGPGPIDNSFLVDAEHVLLSRVEEGRDYDIVSEEAWNLLHQWYSGGPALPRKAIRLNNRHQPIVEVKLMTITFCHKERGSYDTGVSKAETIGDVKKAICEHWNINANEIEVWDGDAKMKIGDMDKQLGELNVFDGQKIYINSDKKRMAIGGKGDEAQDDDDSSEEEDEVQQITNNNGDNTATNSRPSYSSSFASYSYSSSSSSSSSYFTPYSSASSSSYPYTSYSSYSSYSSYDNAKKHRPSPAGLVGLTNLGNTCFMNSSLQCLSNTVPLAEFFLTDMYARDINIENPLGLKGELAESFANLIKEMWNGHHSSVAPREFKAKLERFATQFSGYQQHDSQELLAFLLDGLHEDLNRVKKKLYGSVREGDDIPDEERVKESWDIHKGRNDSIIVDWFQAILKSTLVCPQCSRISVTFDPFMYLSLPLPTKVDRSIPLVFITRDLAKPPTKYLVKVPKAATIATLKRALGQMAGGIPPDLIIITDVFNSKFFKKFSDSESVDAIDEDRDVIYAYEVAPQTSSSSEGDDDAAGDVPRMAYCAVYNGRKEERSSMGIMSYSSSTQLFGTPFFVSVPCNVTYRELYIHLLHAVSRWMKPDIYAELLQSHIPSVSSASSPSPSDDDDDTSLSSLRNKSKSSLAESNDSTQGTEEHEDGTEDQDDDDDSEEEDTLSEEEGGGASGSNKSGIKVVSSSEEARTRSRGTTPYIFTISTVDNHGYREQPLPMHNEDTPLDLDHCTLQIQWRPDQLAMLDESKFRASEQHSSMNTVDPNDADAITLDKCLSLYTTTERLGPDDPWYCNKCKEFQQATKKFDLWNSPRILVVHLKRFSYRNKYFREKLETLVHYPLRDLDLSRHIIGPKTPAPIYDLYAVSNHYGGMGGGHYTAYALNKGTNKWYKFDDSYVSEMDESQVVSSSAYVLFYRRRDTLAIPPVVPTAAPAATTTDTTATDTDTSTTPSSSSSTTTTTNPTSSSNDIRGDSYYNTHINYNDGDTSTGLPPQPPSRNTTTTTSSAPTTTTTTSTTSSVGYSSHMDLD